jgi:hypothetical protein
VVIEKVQGNMNPTTPIKVHLFDGDARSVSLLLKATSLTAYFTCQSEGRAMSCRLEFSFESPPEPAPCMKNPCFDGGRSQTKTFSGLLVRESLKFAG